MKPFAMTGAPLNSTRPPNRPDLPNPSVSSKPWIRYLWFIPPGLALIFLLLYLVAVYIHTPRPISREPIQVAFAINGKKVLVDKREVTVGDYAQCVSSGQCAWSDSNLKASPGLEHKHAQCNFPRIIERADHPMNCVNLQQALDYCQWHLNAKGDPAVQADLPTRVEWLYAARQNLENDYKFVCGNDPACLEQEAWFNRKNSTAPVHSLNNKPNINGIYAIQGNVWEWTTHDKGGYRQQCGGGWRDLELPPLSDCQLVDKEIQHDDLGFRCVLRIPATKERTPSPGPEL